MNNKECCQKCLREKDSDYWFDENTPVYECIDEVCDCHSTPTSGGWTEARKNLLQLFCFLTNKDGDSIEYRSLGDLLDSAYLAGLDARASEITKAVKEEALWWYKRETELMEIARKQDINALQKHGKETEARIDALMNSPQDK